MCGVNFPFATCKSSFKFLSLLRCLAWVRIWDLDLLRIRCVVLAVAFWSAASDMFQGQGQHQLHYGWLVVVHIVLGLQQFGTTAFTMDSCYGTFCSNLACACGTFGAALQRFTAPLLRDRWLLRLRAWCHICSFLCAALLVQFHLCRSVSLYICRLKEHCTMVQYAVSFGTICSFIWYNTQLHLPGMWMLGLPHLRHVKSQSLKLKPCCKP